ncbi:unnamed protein product [Hymenolepis diminuta]|uniref:Uncharacterized protein n=1 Tax=Hymenolepis diminuta TaxID=6216 RepID=A0A564Y766_HYMDI|nr:unnamed protein product [Hymenolepis diminuta]
MPNLIFSVRSIEHTYNALGALISSSLIGQSVKNPPLPYWKISQLIICLIFNSL